MIHRLLTPKFLQPGKFLMMLGCLVGKSFLSVGALRLVEGDLSRVHNIEVV